MSTNSTITRYKPWDMAPNRLGLGVGLDLPWGERIGFMQVNDTSSVTPRVRRFFDRYGDNFAYAFLAFQPRNRNKLDASDYTEAYDDFFDAVGQGRVRALHQTMFNLGAIEPYDRSEVAAFTNAIAQRYGLRWVVEDVGIWSMKGKAMPYPLPPLLTEAGLSACLANVKDAIGHLKLPLSLEFPGFTEGSNFFVGRMHAFEFFARLSYDSDCAVTLDVGHLLSYQWLQGRTGPRMFEDMDLLPLDQCFELHLSGCSIVQGKFRDAHHGVLLDEQIELLNYLLPHCPRACAITYEDPQFDDEGMLIPKSVRNFERLTAITTEWMSQ